MYFFIGAILEGPEPAVLVPSIGIVSSNIYLIIGIHIFHTTTAGSSSIATINE